MDLEEPSPLKRLAQVTDIELDDWLKLISIIWERRKHAFGADLFYDPAGAILVALGLEANREGLALKDLIVAAGMSGETTSRWLQILIGRGFVMSMPGNRFVLTDQGRAGLQQVFS